MKVTGTVKEWAWTVLGMENKLHDIWSSPHFHTCAHLAWTQVWLSACRFGKVTIIGQLGPVLSKHLRGAFHHFENVQAALFRERTAALKQRTARGAIAHILRPTWLRLTDQTHGILVIAGVDAKRTPHKNYTWRHIYQALIRKLVLIVPKVSDIYTEIEIFVHPVRQRDKSTLSSAFLTEKSHPVCSGI